jgi:phosphatidate cytidylyltransferase
MKNPLSHLSNLQQRVIVGFLGIVLFMGLILQGFIGYILLFGLILSLSLFEFYGLSPFGMPKALKWLGVLGGLLFSWSLLEGIEDGNLQAMVFLGGLWLIMLVWMVLAQWEKPFEKLSWIVMGWMYLVPAWVCMTLLAIKDHEDLRLVVFGLFSLLWAADSGAYFVGRKWGKTKLFEKVSPKKSWEGLAGGVVFSLAVAYGFSYWAGYYSTYLWMILALSTTIFGTLGDLAESTLKRSLNIKDSGQLLPGHGGILDRFDGLFLAAPANYLIVLAYYHYFN